MYRKPKIFDAYPEIIAAESTRKSGNLGLFTQDTKSAVIANRNHFFNSLGIKNSTIAHAHQCHSDKILLVEQPVAVEGYDALITNHSNIFLTITIADCTPVLIYHPPSGSLAAIHAGWRGTVASIAAKTIQKMIVQFRIVPEQCIAFIGTCIDQHSYEVGEEVAKHFAPAFKSEGEKQGKFYVDLKGANKNQLIQSGLQEKHIEISPYSTFIHNEEYFSYRKEKGQTGRMLAVIGRNS